MAILEGEWAYEQDSFGDWRGYHISGLLRTRLKRDGKAVSALDAAKQDARTWRVQKLVDGEWIDELDRRT